MATAEDYSREVESVHSGNLEVRLARDLEEIDAAHWLAGLGSSRDSPGPPDNERHTVGAFVRGTFPVPQRGIAGLLRPVCVMVTAVVRCKNQQRIVRQIQVIERLHEPPDILVQAVNHPGIHRVALDLVRGKFRFVLPDEFFLGLGWTVRREIRQEREERAIVGPLETLYHFIGQSVGEVIAFLAGQVPDHWPGIEIRAGPAS